MKLIKDHLTLVGVLVGIVILVVAIGGWLLNRGADEQVEHVAEMAISTERDGVNYCAEFVADNVDRRIEITITNCGDATIEVHHGKTITRVDAGKDYETALSPLVKKFRATIASTDGEFIGVFSL